MPSPLGPAIEKWNRLNEDGFKVIEELAALRLSHPEMRDEIKDIIADFGEEFLKLLEGYLVVETIHNILNGVTQETAITAINTTGKSVQQRMQKALYGFKK